MLKTTPKLYTTESESWPHQAECGRCPGRDQLLPRQHHQGEIDRRSDGRQPAATIMRCRPAGSIRQPPTRISSAMSWRAASAIPPASPTSSPTRPMPGSPPRSISRLTAKRQRPAARRSSRSSTNTCARRWKRMPARPMRACGWRSISSARRRPSPTGTTCWPTRRWPAWCAPRSACPIPSPPPISTSRRRPSRQSSTSTDFTDPAKLDKFLTRFTSLWEINHPTSTAQTSVGVLFAQPTTVGISTDLMMAMQKLKF